MFRSVRFFEKGIMMFNMKLEKLTTEEKLRLLCGKDSWHTCDFEGKLPFVKVTDASMGVRMPANTEEWGGGDKPSVSYPSSQMLANSWNLQAVRAYAECVADDCLDYGADILLGPGVNIKRNPLCGRNFEYYSEDPYLAGIIAREYISAMQQEGAGACVKHFCCNNLEYNRLLQSSEVDERTLREIYYKPFEIACEAKPVSVMCSYNKINGVQGSEYKKGFSVLRNEYGFDGAIMSDWGAVFDHAKAARAGLDLEMPFSQHSYEKLLEDYKSGRITEEQIDACAARVLDMVVRCKALQKDKKRKYTQEERIEISQEIAQEGIVLLKNEGVLPLAKGQKISTCGLYGAPYSAGRDNSHYLAGGGSGRVVRLTKEFDIPEALRKQGFFVSYDAAFGDTGLDNAFMNPRAAIENAAESDVNIVFAGTGAAIETEGNDRKSMKLSDVQERAILDTAAVNPNTVVVLFAGAPIDMSAWINEVAAVVWAGFPGERGDIAVANILTGKVNPSGKLTETFPLCYEDTPAANGYLDGTVTRYEEGLDVGYRYYDTYGVDVLFPFGFGLSYADFNYKNLTLKTAGENLEVNFELENGSQVDGKEVSQIYVRAMSSYVYRPYKELKGFTKMLVKAGKTEKVQVVLDKRAFEYWSVGSDGWEVEDGIYEIIVAASVSDEKFSAKIKIQNKKITVL